MYDQIRVDILFIILYSVVTAMAMMASCYLLFRRGNAFDPDITPPDVLKRFTDNILLVGISYDETTKQHTCKIER